MKKIHETAIIGTAPFSFAENGERKEAKLGVIVGKNVEIGPFTEVHNGRYGDTIINDGVKIAGHVGIGNSVSIGKNTWIASGVKIAAKCSIGQNVRIWIGALIKQRLVIGDNAIIGMGSVVLHDVPPNCTVVGNPAKIIKDGRCEQWHKEHPMPGHPYEKLYEKLYGTTDNWQRCPYCRKSNME
jgi:UDP-3-O-[3-hydroxymyristoyl] glucosamine N-acyltransferase